MILLNIDTNLQFQNLNRCKQNLNVVSVSDKLDQNLTSSRSKSIVVLEETYQKKILSLIHKTMNTSEISTPELDDKSWNIENNDDFKYGHRIGFLFGIVIGDYMATYDKFPPEEDLFEIRDILKSKIDEIKSSVLDHYFYYR